MRFNKHLLFFSFVTSLLFYPVLAEKPEKIQISNTIQNNDCLLWDGNNVFAQDDYDERVVLIQIKKSVLDIANNIKQLNFDFSKVSSGVPSDTIQDTLFIKEAFDFDGNCITKSQLMVKFFPNIKTLFIKYKPEYLARVFNPPFDTLQYNFKGELVKLPDLSIHYKIRMRNEKYRTFFVNELKILEGVLNADVPRPTEFKLLQNYPNPFNTMTTIRYKLPEWSYIELKILDLMGREIRTLIDGHEEAGYKNVMWDGKDSYGNNIASGMYLYRINAISDWNDPEEFNSIKEFHQTRKMVLLR